ncbi:MAG: hypothetical protein Q9170_004415 [Blastenia crenularia]
MAGQPMPMQVGSQPQPAGLPPQGGQVQQFILRTLSQQPTPQGWQSSVQAQIRANIVFQIFSQLRLLKDRFDLQYALNLAMNFEGKEFAESPDRNMYEQHCKRKMEEIHQMRTKQSAGMQRQMNQQMNMPQHMQNMAQAMAQNQGQVQGQFSHGLPNAQQQQMMQLQGMQMQQKPPQQPGRQQPHMATGQHPVNIPQGQPSTSQQTAPQPNQYTPTHEENQWIQKMAQHMFQETPPEKLEGIRNNFRGMNPEQRQNFERQGLDPLAFFFRTQASKRFMALKRSQASAQAGAMPPSSAMVNGNSRPSQNTGRPTGQQISGAQPSFEPPFDQIIGQQQDALRSQEAGQVVVPASIPQASLDQRNAARVNAQQQMNMQNGGNRSMQNANPNQPFWNSQQAQRSVTAAPGVKGGVSTANFPNGQAPSNVLQGQPGGLDNQITRTPSQTRGLPNLNKAAAPPGQTPNMWPQRPPQAGQDRPPGAPLPMQQSTERPEAVQQKPQIFQNMPPHMQQQLLNMPEEQRRAILMTLHKRQQQQQQLQAQMGQQVSHQAAKVANARAAMNEAYPMSNQASQPGMQTGPAAAAPNQTMAVPQTTMQQSNGIQPGFPKQASPFGLPSRQQPAPGQTPLQQRGNPQQSTNAVHTVVPLNKEQQRQMDQQMFHPEILSKGSQLAQTPREVKTWGQLKDWVSRNASLLPPNTLTKLEQLQAMQYRMQQQRSGPTQPGVGPGGLPQQQAPFAQMVSQPNMQPPVAASRPPNSMNIPPPSLEEIQAIRMQLPPTLKGSSDAQVSGLIMRNKQRSLAQAQAQALQNSNGTPKGQQAQQVQQNQAQGPSGQSNISSHQQPSQTRSPGQQPQKTPTQTVKQGQGSRMNAATKKRQSPDDVVEVPNPGLTTQQAGANGQPSRQLGKQQSAQPTQAEKAPPNPPGSLNQRKSTSNQPETLDAPTVRPQGVPSLSKEESDRRDARLRQLMTEIGKNQPLRRPVPMSAPVKAQVAQKLREFGPLIQRMESSFPQFFRHNHDENVAKQLIQIRLLIKAQYLDNHFNLVDQFTISPGELDDATSKIKQYFAYVMRTFSKRPNNASQPGEQQQMQRHPQQPAGNQEKAQLSAANLKEQQKQQDMLQAQRAAAMQKQHLNHGNRAPPAPTSDKPPFPLGPQSPHGIPLYHQGPTTLTADQLVLPVPKRRKSNHHQPSAGSTPIPVQEAKSSPLNIKLSSPEVQKTAIPQMSFKCGISSCTSGQMGFATQSELEQHNADEHEPKEEIIEDPWEFALESMRTALGLDENGKSKLQTENIEAPAMKASLSAQSHKSIKQEASTPMARANTQTGPSPSSNFLKTPQANQGVKSPVPNARSRVQEGKGRNGKGPEALPQDTTPSPVDPWAGSLVSPEDITSAWSSLADMQSMPFTKIQMGLTPSSTLSSGNDKSEKNSPRPSDISENDAAKTNLDAGNENKDRWIPSEWLVDSLYGEIESLGFDQDNFAQDNLMEDFDFDIFGNSKDTVMVDTGASTGKGKKTDEQDVISEEWLKVYAPERLPAKKGR